jgi:site-specific DNA recombinase
MAGKLYCHHEFLLITTIKLLEEIAARQEQGNTKLYELNTALADLNEKAHTLQRLHNKGFIEDADFREQSDALASQRKKLSDQRAQAIHGSKALETLDRLRELQRQLESLPEIPWEFDIGLFDQLVEKIVPISNTEMLFKLRCGLELKEVIPQ